MKNNLKVSDVKGFTLLEVLIVIGIIAILASVALVAINPSRQFMMARDSERLSNVESIANAISQNMSENKGVFTCSGTAFDIPDSSTSISDDGANIAGCLAPDYLAIFPIDPNSPDAHYNSDSDYDTGYFLFKGDDNRISVKANGEMTPEIKAVR